MATHTHVNTDRSGKTGCRIFLQLALPCFCWTTFSFWDSNKAHKELNDCTVAYFLSFFIWYEPRVRHWLHHEPIMTVGTKPLLV